jgi:hypothetical protein
MYVVSLRFLCSAHSWHSLAGYFFLPSPTATILYSLCLLKSPNSLHRGSCLGPLGTGCVSGHCSLSELGSVVFCTFDIHDLSTWCRKLLNFLFLCSVFCTQKMHWAVHSLADTIPTFSTIWQFSSKLSNNWGTGLNFLRPLWIYCTGQQRKVSLFTGLFFCLSFLCFLMLCRVSCLSRHKSFLLPCLDHDVTLPPECWLPFFQLAGFPF